MGGERRIAAGVLSCIGKWGDMRTILGLGNCHIEAATRAASVALGIPGKYLRVETVAGNEQLLSTALRDAELVITRARCVSELKDLAASNGARNVPILILPRLYFHGFHPDVATPVKQRARECLELPMTTSNSAILLAAWREELTAKEARTLFRDEVYERLGYYEAFAVATGALSAYFRDAGLDLEPFMQAWMNSAPFFHVPVHPKAVVLKDLMLAKLRDKGLYSGDGVGVSIQDEMARRVVWPVYPEIADRLGIAGDYIFKPRLVMPKGFEPPANHRSHAKPMDLDEFIGRTYECYRQSPPDLSRFHRMSDPRLTGLANLVVRPNRKREGNPYRALPSSNWWSDAVGRVPFSEVDPVSKVKFTVGRNDRIATAGSCFAQHIARRLASEGFNYLVTEPAPGDCTDAAGEGYGTFTARCGNIYTVQQLLQLAKRAFGGFTPAIEAWELAAGGYVDPFRPRIGTAPFATIADLRFDRERHFSAVREMFETADVFIFTLGLTECWRSREDKAVVPLPPGAVGAKVSAGAYVPKNFTVTEVIGDLERLVALFAKLNRSARLILTVSPVPLIATFEDEHVLSATTYSKSVLRAAAGEIARANANVAYFPSYEIVTGSFNRGRYFAEDLRQVTSAGVDHVMSVFLKHYGGFQSAFRPAASADVFAAEAAAAMDIVCDEESLES